MESNVKLWGCIFKQYEVIQGGTYEGEAQDVLLKVLSRVANKAASRRFERTERREVYPVGLINMLRDWQERPLVLTEAQKTVFTIEHLVSLMEAMAEEPEDTWDNLCQGFTTFVLLFGKGNEVFAKLGIKNKKKKFDPSVFIKSLSANRQTLPPNAPISKRMEKKIQEKLRQKAIIQHIQDNVNQTREAARIIFVLSEVADRMAFYLNMEASLNVLDKKGNVAKSDNIAQNFAINKSSGRKPFSEAPVGYVKLALLDLVTVERTPEEYQTQQEKYFAYLKENAEKCVAQFDQQDFGITAMELLKAKEFDSKKLFNEGLPGLYQVYGAKMTVVKQYQDVLEADPKDHYPEARTMKRHFVLHVSTDPNTEFLKTTERLQANEIALGEGSRSSYHAGVAYDKIFLTDLDLLVDERDSFMPSVILGAVCPEIHCFVFPEYADLLGYVVEYCGDTWEKVRTEISYPALSPLKTMVKTFRAKDMYVCSGNARKVLNEAQKISDLDYSVAVVHSEMTEEFRLSQLALFIEGKVEVLVVDASFVAPIALPVRRLILGTDSKANKAYATQALVGDDIQRMVQYNQGTVKLAKESERITSCSVLLERRMQPRLRFPVPPPPVIKADEKQPKNILYAVWNNYGVLPKNPSVVFCHCKELNYIPPQSQNTFSGTSFDALNAPKKRAPKEKATVSPAFIAVVEKSVTTTKYYNSNGMALETVINLSQIHQADGTFVKNSTTMNYTKGFQDLGLLHSGDILSFSAKREGYFLSHPTKVKRIETLPDNIPMTPSLQEALNPEEIVEVKHHRHDQNQAYQMMSRTADFLLEVSKGHNGIKKQQQDVVKRACLCLRNQIVKNLETPDTISPGSKAVDVIALLYRAMDEVKPKALHGDPEACQQNLSVIAVALAQEGSTDYALFQTLILDLVRNTRKSSKELFGDVITTISKPSEEAFGKAYRDNFYAKQREAEKKAEKERKEREKRERKANNKRKEISINAILPLLTSTGNELLESLPDGVERRLAKLVHQRILSNIRTLKKGKSQCSKEGCIALFQKFQTLDSVKAGTLVEGIVSCADSAGIYPEAFPTYVEAYKKGLMEIAKRVVEEAKEKLPGKNPEEILNAPYFTKNLFWTMGLVAMYNKYAAPEEIKTILRELIPAQPKDEFPKARIMHRAFIIHVGGTNTGKTYQGIERLKTANTGVYLSPLRLLALEVQERLKEADIACSLLTGEEEDMAENATHMSSTMEKLNIQQEYEVAVLDECQMIGDQDRGFAWTRAILGCQAKEIHCCVAPEGLNAVIKAIEHCGDSYVIEEHQRKTPLTYDHSIVTLNNAQKGDVFVAFSRKAVLQMAHELSLQGKPASVIYGALPYQARRAQMERFLSGETRVLVATDAIGMGLNLPIRRVVFTNDSKFDGTSVRHLKSGEVKQIAGRAGRFGIYDQGYVCRAKKEISIKKEFEAKTPDIKQAYLGFSEVLLDLDYDIVDVLKVWWSMPTTGNFKKTDIKRHLELIQEIRQRKIDLTKQDLLKATMVPFSERESTLLDLFLDYLKRYLKQETIPFPQVGKKGLEELELGYKKLDLYYSFSRAFGMAFDHERLNEEKLRVSEAINEELVNLKNTHRKKCSSCGCAMPALSQHGMCQGCFESRRSYHYGYRGWNDNEWDYDDDDDDFY